MFPAHSRCNSRLSCWPHLCCCICRWGNQNIVDHLWPHSLHCICREDKGCTPRRGSTCLPCLSRRSARWDTKYNLYGEQPFHLDMPRPVCRCRNRACSLGTHLYSHRKNHEEIFPRGNRLRCTLPAGVCWKVPHTYFPLSAIFRRRTIRRPEPLWGPRPLWLHSCECRRGTCTVRIFCLSCRTRVGSCLWGSRSTVTSKFGKTRWLCWPCRCRCLRSREGTGLLSTWYRIGLPARAKRPL